MPDIASVRDKSAAADFSLLPLAGEGGPQGRMRSAEHRVTARSWMPSPQPRPGPNAWRLGVRAHASQWLASCVRSPRAPKEVTLGGKRERGYAQRSKINLVRRR
ncbi:hypothetical protein [Lysobacter gummosus]|uniref:hypothetical protein n=1 Tax=Lysobacter gummosus TaxID=262324 RepID=UPI003645E736